MVSMVFSITFRALCLARLLRVGPADACVVEVEVEAEVEVGVEFAFAFAFAFESAGRSTVRGVSSSEPQRVSPSYEVAMMKLTRES